VRDAVVRLRYPQRQDLPGIYSGAAVFVFPSLVEGFGFPPLEAMACGTPIVASNIPVLQETLGGAAITVPPDDPKLLALAIHKVLTNAFLRRSLIERGAERARQFNWPDTADRMVAVYEEVASASQRRA
jgi:glycosyltransferase involved in cell wall biosynthesis